MSSGVGSRGSVVAAAAAGTVASALFAVSAVPSDALRRPRKLVAGYAGVCALADAGPMRCWGATPFEDPTQSGAVARSRGVAPFARPSSAPDADDVALDADRGGGCALEHGALRCGWGNAWERGLVFAALRSAPEMRNVHAPATAGAWVCVVARAEGGREEAVWCRERVGVTWDQKQAEVADGWERLDLGEVASIAMGGTTAAPSYEARARRLCARLRTGGVRCVDFPERRSFDVPGIEGAVELALGDGFGCARDAAGEVRCFGDGSQGQLGDGDRGPRADARPVPLPGPATALAASYGRACAVVAGAPYCWGVVRPEGALPRVVAHAPRRVADLDHVGQLALGYGFACATVTADGTVRCVGRDADGQLGDGSFLPLSGCFREGITGTSPERERPAGPTVARTGDAGAHPTWRLPILVLVASMVLVPLAWARALASAALRELSSPSRAARDALQGAGLLAASLAPIALARALPAAIAPWGDAWEVQLKRGVLAPAALAGLGPLVALAVALIAFADLRRAREEALPAAARRAAAWLGGSALLLLTAMLATPRVNEEAREELVYRLRDAALDLGPFFFARSVASFAWIVGVVAYAAFALRRRARAERP